MQKIKKKTFLILLLITQVVNYNKHIMQSLFSSLCQKKVISFFLVILIFTTLFGQGQNEKQNQINNLIDYTNYVYGTNDILVNGLVYMPLHLNAEGHPFFMEGDWENGKIYIKGRVFNDIELKYDIEIDRVILKAEVRAGTYEVLVNDAFVDSCIINNRMLINSNNIFKDNPEFTGYFELVYEGNFLFLVKHQKTFISEYSENNQFGLYSDPTSEYILLKGDKINKIYSKKALLKYFKPNKRLIKRFLKKNKIKYKKINSNELFNLLKYCDTISSVN